MTVRHGGGPRHLRDRLLGQAAAMHRATAVFALYCVVAFPLVVLHIGRFHWFFRDEWAFLAGRDGGNVSDLFEPHNEHWDTVGVVVFRSLYAVFGLRTYVPYQAVAVLFHLLVVVAVFLLMRKSGVRPVIAAVAAGAFVLFGPGAQNIVSGFQVAFTGAVGFVLVQMLLLDHDGRWQRRDTWGVVAGATALMCSGIAIPMVVGMGAFALIRRGWRVALAHTGPLAALYLGWYAIHSPSTTTPVFGRPSFDVLTSYVWHGEVGGLVALSATPQLAIPLVGLTVIGVAIIVAGKASELARRSLTAPVILALVSVVNLGLIAQGRWLLGVESARVGRYLYLTAVLSLPLIALAIEACARVWRPLVGLSLLLAIAIPANATNFTDKPFDEAYHEDQERLIRSIPVHPLAHDVPPDHDPFGISVSPFLTVGFILDAYADGDIASVPGTTADRNHLSMRFSFATGPVDGSVGDCRTDPSPLHLTTEAGSTMAVRTDVQVRYDADTQAGAAQRVRAGELFPVALEFLLDDVPLRLTAVGGDTVTTCDLTGG